jgi:hypothetical protein
LSPPSSI